MNARNIVPGSQVRLPHWPCFYTVKEVSKGGHVTLYGSRGESHIYSQDKWDDWVIAQEDVLSKHKKLGIGKHIPNKREG